jgi:acetyltransferase-like isoleucine patch superfamily enzyme
MAARFGAFGDGSCLTFPPGAVFGERWIHIGSDTLIGPGVSLSAGMVPGQQMVTDPVVRIGDRCMIGRGSHIVGHFEVHIGDDVHTGPYVYITDQNHGYRDPDQVVHSQWPSDVPVTIGTGSWLGTGVVILPGTVLGRNVVVGAGSVVRGTFPDRCVIAGVPARIVRRHVPGRGWVSGSED